MIKRSYAVGVVYIVCFLGYLIHRYDNPYSFLSGNDVVSLKDKVVWCMLFVPVWMPGMWLYDKSWQQSGTTVYRYGSILRWWNIIGARLAVFILSSYLLLCIGLVLVFPAALTYERIQILGWLVLHALGLLLIGLLLGLFIKDISYVGVALILMELGIGADISAAPWHGFMILVEAMLFVSLFFLFPNSRKGLLIRKLAYEKND